MRKRTLGVFLLGIAIGLLASWRCRSTSTVVDARTPPDNSIQVPAAQALPQGRVPITEEQVRRTLRRVIDELCYPAVLGAVLVWFAEAVAHSFSDSKIFDGGCHNGYCVFPSIVALPIGFLLFLYSPAVALTSLSRRKRQSSEHEFSMGALFIDVLEILSIFFVFYFLGYIEHSHDAPKLFGAFISLTMLTSLGVCEGARLRSFPATGDQSEHIYRSWYFVLASAMGTGLICLGKSDYLYEFTIWTLCLPIVALYVLLYWYYRDNWPSLANESHQGHQEY